MPLSPSYDPKHYEPLIYKRWQEESLGSPEQQIEKQQLQLGAESFATLMPPPNLTGPLHTGHTFQHYLMDYLTRIARQQGVPALWYPGVDHAGLQLEGVINKFIRKGEFDDQLSEEERDPQWLKDNNPEKWLKLAWSKVDEWRDLQQNQAAILGDTPDYARSLFTLDDRAVAMVQEAFIRYWEDGLLYKNSYLVSWSVGLQTALSDVAGEIDYVQMIDPLVTFQYAPVELGYKSSQDKEEYADIVRKLKPITEWPRLKLSTVRPETKFTDLAVAMHPTKVSEYFSDNIFVGDVDQETVKNCVQAILDGRIEVYYDLPPLKSEKIKLVFSDKVDPDFGTGLVKITPGHDMFDYELYHEMVELGRLPAGAVQTCINRDGTLKEEFCGEFGGMTVQASRPLIIKRMLETGYITAEIDDDVAEISDDEFKSWKREKQEKYLQERFPESEIDWKYEHNVTICERTKTIVEPLISEEFFLSYRNTGIVSNKTLQQTGLDGIEQTEFFSADFKERGQSFLENIKDWVISRDLVWGHKMPVWYDLNTNPHKQFGGPQDLIKGLKIQAEKPTEDGEWVQEEKILDTWFSSCIWPLTTLDFHGHEQGKTTDFDAYYSSDVLVTGTDIFYQWIVRMITLCTYFTGKTPFKQLVVHGTIQDEKGRKMSKSLGNGLDPVEAINSFSSDSLRMSLLGSMIPNRNMRMGGSLADRLMEKYRNFANKIWNIARFFEYQEDQQSGFVETGELSSASHWIESEFTDLQKVLATSKDEYKLSHSVDALYTFFWDKYADWYVEYLKTDPSQLHFAKSLFERMIITLSPFMPFLCEALWKDFFGNNDLLSWEIEKDSDIEIDQEKVRDFKLTKNIITSIRSQRGLFAIDPGLSIQMDYTGNSLENSSDYIKLLTRTEVAQVDGIPDESYSFTIDQHSLSFDLKSYLEDVSAEKSRTEKHIESIQKQINSLEKQLTNQGFLKNALPEVVAEKRQDLEDRNIELANNKHKLKFLL